MTEWYLQPCPAVDQDALQSAKTRQSQLTKPAGSLGRLETVAEYFAAWQGVEKPVLDNIMVRVFAGDHGVCERNISAFPQQVTGQMVMNFLNGGAAISVLSRSMRANFAVVNMGLAYPLPIDQHDNLVNANIAPGTADFSQQAAMKPNELTNALEVGRKQIIDTHNTDKPLQLFIGGEMGIGNTTSASAIYCALLGLDAKEAVGPGTGLDKSGQQHKAKVITEALELHGHNLSNELEVLRCLGGLEIAGLVGSYLAAGQSGVPVLVDGFISTAAALLAVRINPSLSPWLLFAHRSAEPAHLRALQALDTKPLLDLSMRLGEGSGAAVAVSLLKSALDLHNNMATFAEATVSEKT